MVSLETFKKHVRADDFASDDDLLQLYLDTAVEAVARETHRSVEELCEMGGGELPLPIQQAVMLIAASWYNQREDVSSASMQCVPVSSRYLVSMYRKLV